MTIILTEISDEIGLYSSYYLLQCSSQNHWPDIVVNGVDISVNKSGERSDHLQYLLPESSKDTSLNEYFDQECYFTKFFKC